MIIFVLCELRRWSGEHKLCSVYFERTGKVKWMLEGSDPGYQLPPAHTLFHGPQPRYFNILLGGRMASPPTRDTAPGMASLPTMASSPPLVGLSASDLASITVVVNPGTENQNEAVFRLGVIGLVSQRHNDRNNGGFVGLCAMALQ